MAEASVVSEAREVVDEALAAQEAHYKPADGLYVPWLGLWAAWACWALWRALR